MFALRTFTCFKDFKCKTCDSEIYFVDFFFFDYFVAYLKDRLKWTRQHRAAGKLFRYYIVWNTKKSFPILGVSIPRRNQIKWFKYGKFRFLQFFRFFTSRCDRDIIWNVFSAFNSNKRVSSLDVRIYILTLSCTLPIWMCL